MADPDKKPLKKQISKTSLEQSLSMISAPQTAPITIYPGPGSDLASLSKEDLEIAQRLQNLKQRGREILPTEEEMASRLAQLKGLPADHYQKPSGPIYQPPDTRTQAQKSEDLLSQVAEEVALDLHIPKPEDEIETRLAKLRGSESQHKASCAAFSSAAYRVPSHAEIDSNLGDELEDTTLDEVESLMQAAAKDAEEDAEQAIANLHRDPEVAQAIALASKKKKRTKKKGESSTSDEERYSGSDIEVTLSGDKSYDAKQEQKEIERIVRMYTKAAEEKKLKRKKKREEAAARGEDVSDSSDLESLESEPTPDSEKFSSSEELSD